MIINIRGTSGSGKSHIVRRVMEWYPGQRYNIMRDGRRQPIGYLLLPTNNTPRSLYIAGHYETTCGGCDTITKQDDIAATVRRAASEKHNVLFEGLLWSAEVRRTAEIAKDFDMHIFAIDLPLEECLAAVNERRHKRNPELPPVNPKNTEAKFKHTQRSMERLTEMGVKCTWGTREQVLQSICQLLGISLPLHVNDTA